MRFNDEKNTVIVFPNIYRRPTTINIITHLHVICTFGISFLLYIFQSLIVFLY